MAGVVDAGGGGGVAKHLAFLRKRDILHPASQNSPSPAEPHGGGLTHPFCGGVQAGAPSGLHHAAPCKKGRQPCFTLLNSPVPLGTSLLR